MNDEGKIKKEPIEELKTLQQRISELEKSNIELSVEVDRLEDTQGKYRIIAKDLAEGYFELDLTGNFTFFNDSMCRMLDYSPAELMGMNNREFTTPETARRMSQIFRKIYRTGRPARIADYEVILKDGSRKIVDMSAYLMRDSKGNPTGFFGLDRDVTERIQMEEALRKSEERYRTILDTIEDGYYEVDLAGTLTFCNDSMCRIAGIAYEDLVGMNNRGYVNPETAKEMYRVFSEVYRTGNPAEVTDYEIIRPDGTRRIVGLSTTLLRDSLKEPVGFCGTVRDLTEKKRGERLYQAVAEQSFAGIYVIREGKFLYINARAAGYTDHTPEELMGKDPMSIVHPDDREALKEHAREMLKGKRKSFYEYRMVTKTGDIRWIIETVTPIVFEGKPATLGSSMDITDRKKIEEELRASEIRYRTIIENTGTAMLILEDDMTISMTNSGFEEMVGYPADEIEGKKKWTEFVAESDVKRMVRYHRARRKAPDAAPPNYEFKLIGRTGRILDVFLTISSIQETRQSVVSLIDITERKGMEESLRYMGTHDSLTDLYNRAFFEEEMARLERGRVFPVSIVMVDVDELKVVNDTEGHKAGDDLLKRTARVLRESFRKDDTVARIGGDEFAVILPRTDAPVTGKTIKRVRRFLAVHNKDHPESPLSLSIGAATGEKGALLAGIQSRADKLMYEEKMTKRGLLCRIPGRS
ncbi:MAG: PAS domain S-box protein [Deltaproteobacteria bacterium]|nr:PAS domain S-box protein [Deltaproteobacteria bacterium]